MIKMTQKQLEAKFPTEDACYAEVVQMRWPDGPRCPRCQSEKVHKLSRAWRWQCKRCSKNGYRFSPLVGTIFENTNVPLRTWFTVIYLMCQSKKGMSALQIQRLIGKQQLKKGKPDGEGSYKTAWYMCHRIRAAMQGDQFPKLTGIVEIDETYVGGKEGNKHLGQRSGRQGTLGKVGVIGAISRKGNVTCRVIEAMDTETVGQFVKDTINDVVELVATDDHKVYEHMYWGPLRKHESVNHSAEEYVRGIVHTASIDSFWSLLKRGIMGQFHHVSKKYLPLYVNEFAFRHNHRESPDIFRAVLAGC